MENAKTATNTELENIDKALRRIVASGMLCPPAATLAATRLMANSALGSDKNTKVIL